MAQSSKIEWTDASWNPIRGCSRVSEGCRNCYAESIAARFSGPGKPYEGLAKFVTSPGGREARWTGKTLFVEDQLLAPLRWKKPKRIFVNSMSDLFHEGVERDHLDLIYHVMAAAYWHTFQVLTKRPERMRDYLCDPQTQKRQTVLSGEIHDRLGGLAGPFYRGACPTLIPVGFDPDDGHMINLAGDWSKWPLPNVWHGVSVENQLTADERIPWLLDTPSVVRFLSCEPLLGPIDLTKISCASVDPDSRGITLCALTGGRKSSTPWHINWVICGGESGPDARPMHPDWARDLRDQCTDAFVPFFFKQWGEWGAGSYLMTTGEPSFRQFDSFNQWVNKASTWVNGGLCLDKTGRVLKSGADFMRASDEGAFPVVILHKTGRERAGRRLDGSEWNEVPTPLEARAA
jgi:protein gp37